MSASGVALRLRSLLRALRRTPERALHGRRRKSARRWLEECDDCRTLTFLCHGNICRSPYAAHALERKLPPVFSDRLLVESAGFIGPGRPSPAEAVEVAAERGVDLSQHRSQLVTPDLLSSADLVFVMDAQQRRRIRISHRTLEAEIMLLGDLDPEPIESRAIRDPVCQSREVFEEVYDRIDRCLGTLATLLVQRS